MDRFNLDAAQELIVGREGPCVSIFLTTHPVGRDGEQDRIRLKNLAANAEAKLAGHWMRSSDARDFIVPIESLTDDVDFWGHRSHGLAVYAAAKFLKCFRVPSPLAESLNVGTRFCLRPVLPLLENNQSFFLLTISANQTALYEIDEQSIRKIDVPGLPASMSELMNYDDVERGSQVHSGDTTRQGKQAAVFHGHGGKPDTNKDDQLAFCSRVNDAVTSWLGDSKHPLLLGGVNSLVIRYRDKNTYKHLLDETFSGNHDRASESELQQGAYQIAKPLLNANVDAAITRFAERDRVSVADDPIEVIRAACQGQVETLLYDPHAELFGECAPHATSVTISGDAIDDDLVNLAAIETLKNGGRVYSVANRNVPTNSPIAAILRF